MADEGRPNLWQEYAELERRVRDIERSQEKITAQLASISSQMNTLVRVGLTVLAGLLAVAVTIALAVGHH